MTQTVLVTGGAGYIGSHTCVSLLNAGFDVIVIDNLCNSHVESLRRVQQITRKKIHFQQTDIRDGVALKVLFRNHKISAVIHFAALKSVGESVQKPLLYYDNNVNGALTLLKAMDEAGVRALVFSSSATVYGNPHAVPIKEDFPLSATNPYGRSKLIIEDVLRDIQTSNPEWSVALLRYFNPVGAHESGLIGEHPSGIPNNLMPYISQVAVGKRKELLIFGDDYPTSDGTGVRDYIHVMDLADGHVKALKALDTQPLLLTVNLGTGKGYSVLEIVKTFESVSGHIIPYRIAPRRPGDVAANYANTDLAANVLGWKARYNLEKMCEDSWRWQRQNPNGFSA